MPCAARVSLHGALTAPMCKRSVLTRKTWRCHFFDTLNPRWLARVPACQKKPGLIRNRNPRRLSTEPDDMCVRFGMPCAARASLHGALTALMCKRSVLTRKTWRCHFFDTLNPCWLARVPACQKNPGLIRNRNPRRLSTEPDDMCVRFGMPCAARVSLRGALTAPMCKRSMLTRKTWRCHFFDTLNPRWLARVFVRI